MANVAGVKVIGLKELTARLAQAATYEPQLVRDQLAPIAQAIVDEVIPEMKSSFVSDPSRRDGALEDSLRASTTVGKRGASASIKEGSKGSGDGDHKVPYAGWFEFGGPRAKSHRPPNRTFVKNGRFLFPTVKKRRAEIQAAVEAALQELAKMIEGR